MAGEQFKMKSGADIVNVPYKGTGPALTDVLAGQVELMFASTINVLPHLQGGKIKVLGVTSAEPMKQFPGVKPIGPPSRASSPMPGSGFSARQDCRRMSPRGCTRQRGRRSSRPPSRAGSRRTERGRLTMKPQAFADFVVQDVKRWAEVIRFSGATVE